MPVVPLAAEIAYSLAQAVGVLFGHSPVVLYYLPDVTHSEPVTCLPLYPEFLLQYRGQHQDSLFDFPAVFFADVSR